MRASRRAWWAFGVGCAAALAACGSHDSPADAGGQEPTNTTPVLVRFVAQPVNVAGLTLSTATMRIDHLRVVGDRPPPPGSGGGGAHPSPDEEMLALDLLGTDGGSVTQNPPPGLYSRVQFDAADVRLVGTWRGTPFTAHVASFTGQRVDLRAGAREVTSGADAGAISFTVTVDPSDWFAAPAPLDEVLVGQDAGIEAEAAADAGEADASADGDGGTTSDADAGTESDAGAEIVCASPVNPPCSIALTARLQGSFSLQ